MCYKAQSVFRIIYLVKKLKINPDLEKSFQEFKKINFDYNKWFFKNSILSIECNRTGNHNFKSVDIASKVRNLLEKNNKLNFSYKNPEAKLYLYIRRNIGYFGIDFAGCNLSKRDYKIFQSKSSIKGTLAYSLVRLSGFSLNKILVDSFTNEGIIPIEAALFSLNFPVNYYSKDKFSFQRLKPVKELDLSSFYKKIDLKILKNKSKIYGIVSQPRFIKFAQKNSKIAGINKFISFSKVDVDWLDTKFEKNSIDCFVSFPPLISKNNKKIEKIYNELFYQLNYILKNKGKIVILTNNSIFLKKIIKYHKFKITKTRVIYTGKQSFEIIIITKT